MLIYKSYLAAITARTHIFSLVSLRVRAIINQTNDPSAGAEEHGMGDMEFGLACRVPYHE